MYCPPIITRGDARTDVQYRLLTLNSRLISDIDPNSVMIKHAGSCAYTLVRAGTRGLARVHARTRGYTRVRVIMLNAMHLAHKWTEKWTKYATGEDAGSGAWTRGRAGSRGFARVRAGSRGFARVRAGSRGCTRGVRFLVLISDH